MSFLAWWAIPVVATLSAGVIITLRGRTPNFDSTSREIERFRAFRDALGRQVDAGVSEHVVPKRRAE